jgi:hypothetical protein
MSIITIDRTPHPATTGKQPAAKHPGFWARFFDRLIEARQQAAMREIRRHRFLFPREFDNAGWKLSERSEDSLPFRH